MLSDNRGKLLNEYVKDYVIFDLETTGTSCYTDQVVEISAIKVLDEKIVEEFSTLVNPGIPIPYYASIVNGITDDMVSDAVSFDVALADFVNFIGDLPLVGHNIHSFDMKFIYRDLEKYFGKVLDNDYIDTLKLSRMFLPMLSHHKLVDLAAYYNISTMGAHRALNDCRMNQQVYYLLSKEMSEEGRERNGIKLCPNCGQVLKRRKGRFGEFFGCGGYPECRYTENIG